MVVNKDSIKTADGDSIDRCVRKIMSQWFSAEHDTYTIDEIEYRPQSDYERPDGYESYNVYVRFEDGREFSGTAYSKNDTSNYSVRIDF